MVFGQILGFKQSFPNIAVHVSEFYGHSSQSAPALRIALGQMDALPCQVLQTLLQIGCIVLRIDGVRQRHGS